MVAPFPPTATRSSFSSLNAVTKPSWPAWTCVPRGGKTGPKRIQVVTIRPADRRGTQNGANVFGFMGSLRRKNLRFPSHRSTPFARDQSGGAPASACRSFLASSQMASSRAVLPTWGSDQDDRPDRRGRRAMPPKLFEDQVADLGRIVQAAQHGPVRSGTGRSFMPAPTPTAGGIHFHVRESEPPLQRALRDADVLRVGERQGDLSDDPDAFANEQAAIGDAIPAHVVVQACGHVKQSGLHSGDEEDWNHEDQKPTADDHQHDRADQDHGRRKRHIEFPEKEIVGRDRPGRPGTLEEIVRTRRRLRCWSSIRSRGKIRRFSASYMASGLHQFADGPQFVPDTSQDLVRVRHPCADGIHAVFQSMAAHPGVEEIADRVLQHRVNGFCNGLARGPSLRVCWNE